MTAVPPDREVRWRSFVDAYGGPARRELVEAIVPFWQRTLDVERGGVFNCWNNAGTRLVSRDKFTWSQGRFAWLWSRLAELARRGEVPWGAAAFLAHARRTVEFLRTHAFLPDGRCAFLLTEDGRRQEAFPGSGPAPSIYADCFVAMGLAEFARVSGESAPREAAWRLFQQIEARIAAGDPPTFPYPTPRGFQPYALAMIDLNVALVLAEACTQTGSAQAAEANARAVAAAALVVERFLGPAGRIVEMLPRDGADEDSLLSRHVNPGHALEGLWMVLTVAAREQRADWVQRAGDAIEFACRCGWDPEHGGLLHYVDAAGGAPAGTAGDSRYEANVRASWDTKLWWVHTEALYATALAYRLTGDERMRAWFERVWAYAFRVFPHPDRRVGEWIQIRDRRGEPLERVVALPVKDPYHIARNLIQLVELLR